MEGGGSGEEKNKKKKMSFGFSSSHEKIKLIDILSEDDDFLVASPFCDSHQESTREHIGFRLSGFGNTPEVETIQQKEKNLLASHFVQPLRPSFLRRSLAWDSAFFDSPGVLDHDELSFMNKGFTQDIRKRRPESGSMPNSDDNILDWFEIEPSIDKLKSQKVLNVVNRSNEPGLGLPNVQSLKNVDKSSAIKMKSNQTSSGKSINVQKKESTTRRRQGLISSPKPPIGRTTHISTRSSNRDSSRTTTGSGQALVTKKKSASQSSSSLNTGSLSSPTFSPISASSAQAFSVSNMKTGPRKSKLSSSLSTSKIWRHAERNKRMGNVSLSTCSLSLSNHPPSASPAISTRRWPSESLASSVGDKLRSNGSVIGFDKNKKFRVPFLHGDAKEASDSQSNLFNYQATSGTCSVGSLSSAKNVRPSELRPPSPQMRFFDENTPPRYHGLTRNRKAPQKVGSEGTSFGSNPQSHYSNSELLPESSINSRYASSCKKLKSPCSEVAKNVKRPKRNHTEAENPIKKAIDQENGKTCSEDQVSRLSRYLEAIDLNQENATELKEGQTKQETQLLDSPMVSRKLRTPATAAASISNTRTPLADKTSTCNSFRNHLKGE